MAQVRHHSGIDALASRITLNALLSIILLILTISQLSFSVMAFSCIRRLAYRRNDYYSARRTSSCINRQRLLLLGERRTSLASNNHAISKSVHQRLQMPLSLAPLSSSATHNNSNDASASIIISDGVTNQHHESCSNYERLVRKLYMVNLFNPVKLGLDNMEKLYKALGSPMDQPSISVVHIAGSNGKGSVALKIANTLQRSNYNEGSSSSLEKQLNVGLFVSPHISSFRERIQINGQPISEEQVESYLEEIFEICEKQGIPATFFEVTTALAFHIFAKENVGVVVLETGLGGRLDATNVIRRPALSIITSIGLEHTRILGDTIEKIAWEKGGIIKEGCQVLVGSNVPLEVLQQCAKEKKASDLLQCDDLLDFVDASTIVKGTKEVFADYDTENSRIASAALVLLQFHLTQQKLENGGDDVKLILPAEIEAGVKIRPPCRFEEMDILTTIETDDGSTVQKNVRVVLDVAHNPQAMDYLIYKIRSSYPNSFDKRLVVGMSADKDLKYCTDILLDHVSGPEKLHLVEASHPRAAPISSILETNPKLVESHYDTPREDELNESGRDVSSVSKQVRQALKLAAKNDELLVICGSVFIMADAREELGIVEPRDSALIAEVAGAGLRNSQENFGGAKN